MPFPDMLVESDRQAPETETSAFPREFPQEPVYDFRIPAASCDRLADGTREIVPEWRKKDATAAVI
jgi:hypothetical protein